MDPIKIGWKKQLPSDVQFDSNRQHFQQHSIQGSKDAGGKSNKKKVQFNCRLSSAKEQAFEYRKYDSSETARSDRSIFEDHDLASSSMNIPPTE